MQKIKIPLLFFFLFLTTVAGSIRAQGTGGIRGFVTDSLTGEFMSFASVVIEETNYGISTDKRGYFIISSIPAGKNYTLRISYLGYRSIKVKVHVEKDKYIQHDIKLVPNTMELDEVTAYGEKVRKSNATDIGLQTLTMKELEYIPKGVETDILRSLQFVPGVKASSDVTAKFYVRGGASDQNLIMLDGVTLYNPYHAFGIFSIIDPDMINSVQFYKGGFTADMGGRLSSVLNMTTKDGNKNQYSASASSSFLTGKMSVEGPIPNGSFIAAGRKSYINSISKNFLDSKSIPFDFYDASFKVSYMNPELLRNSKFTLNGFVSDDKVDNHDVNKENYSFKNDLVSLQWFQAWEKPVFSEMNFSLSHFEAKVDPNESKAKPRKNTVSDFTMSWDFSYLFESRDELGVGLQAKSFSSLYEFQNLKGIDTKLDDFGGQFDFYVKYKYLRFDNLGIDIGTRLNPASISANGSPFFEPRISMTYRVSPALSFKAAYGLYTQEIMTFTDENEVISLFEPWIIIPQNLSPSQAVHYVLGIDMNPFTYLNVQIEGYYKDLKNLPEINKDKISAADPDLIETKGESYGLEVYLKYQDPVVYSSLAYTLSWAYKYDKGKRYYPRYDSRNSLNYLVNISLGAGWQFGAIFNINTGQPFTQIMGYYDKLYYSDPWNPYPVFEEERPYPLLAEKNAGRLPVYHRLDLTLAKKMKIYKFNISLEANILNVYNRKNIFYFKRDTGERINMLPFLPTASIKIEI
jgi:hypothetical protein